MLVAFAATNLPIAPDGSLLGVIVFGLLVATGFVALGRAAQRSGVLAAVATGVVIRLVVMLAAYAASRHEGASGFLFLDDQTYVERGEALARAWSAGQFVDPSSFAYGGSYMFGYSAIVGGVFVLAGTSILAGLFVNVLAGTATVLWTARLAERVAGPRGLAPAAWMAAVMPSLVWWSAPLMKEAVATAGLTGALLLATRLPRAEAVIPFAAATLALFLVRGVPAAALVVAVAVAVLSAQRLVRRRVSRRDAVLVLGAGVGVVLVALTALARGSPIAVVEAYGTTALSMFDLYQGGNVARLPFDIAKSMVTPLPWAFDDATRNWDRVLYPGMFALFALYPTVGRGAWRVRDRPEGRLLLVTIALILIANAAASGFAFRQRSAIEPLIIVLAVAGLGSWRQFAVWGARALALTIPVSLVASGRPEVALAMAAPAAAVALLARHLPREDLGIEPAVARSSMERAIEMAHWPARPRIRQTAAPRNDDS